jgi:hypothetical protein
MLWAGLLALPVLLACADVAKAQGCASCGPVVGPGRPGGPQPFGCNGFCLRLFGATLQDGPLVNYGPYEGYYPFAPYGPWTSDLRYTGPTSRWPADGACNGGRCGSAWGGQSIGSRLGGLFSQQERGDYALATFRNVFQRCTPCGKGCGF